MKHFLRFFLGKLYITKALEVKSPMLQTMYKLKLKRGGNYSCLKQTRQRRMLSSKLITWISNGFWQFKTQKNVRLFLTGSWVLSVSVSDSQMMMAKNSKGNNELLLWKSVFRNICPWRWWGFSGLFLPYWLINNNNYYYLMIT